MSNSDDKRIINFPERPRGKTKSPDHVDRHVGARIKLQRSLVGMSQEKLGELLGITFQQVQKYEKGTNRVGAGRLLAIARALGVPVSFFFEGHVTFEGAEDTRTESLHSLLTTPEGIALAQAFDRIESTHMRQALVAMAQAAAKERK
jgi:transcriptional regulator with XRE-family HTH domain